MEYWTDCALKIFFYGLYKRLAYIYIEVDTTVMYAVSMLEFSQELDTGCLLFIALQRGQSVTVTSSASVSMWFCAVRYQQ